MDKMMLKIVDSKQVYQTRLEEDGINNSAQSLRRVFKVGHAHILMFENDHPLALELESLRLSFEKYQAGVMIYHAAHVSALQLQRSRLDATDALARVKQLEIENDLIRREVAFLRTNVEPIQASRQTTELSLALRRLSDKLSFTEQSLLHKTSECLDVTSSLNKSRTELKSVQGQINNARTLSEEYTSKENNLNVRCKAAEEEARMAMTVINDYAALVRSLQRDLTLARMAEKETTYILSPADDENGQSNVVLDSFQHSRNSLHQLLFESNSETTSLHVEITRLHNELSAVRTDLEAERETSQTNRDRLAEALLEIERHRTDDLAAERMVSRYMRFSQSSINALQTAVSSLKARHAATLATLSTTSETLSKALEEERTRLSQMRDILDGLTEDVCRETYGRRREVLLRLRYMAREERLLEMLKGWVRQAEEQYSRNASDQSSPSLLLSAYNTMVEEARNILVFSNYSETQDPESQSRIILAEQLCSSLTAELENETKNRLELAKRLATCYTPLPLAALPPDKEDERISTVEHNAPPRTDQSETKYSNGIMNSNPVTLTTPRVEGEEELPTEIQEVQNLSLEDGKTPAEQLTIVVPEESSVENLPDTLDDAHAAIIPNVEEQPPADSKWEGLQKAFTDSHLALQQLKMVLSDKTNISESQRSLLLNVVLRLDDYCEDARVELEIHIADAERIKRGVETARHLRSLAQEMPKDELNQLFGESTASNGFETFQTRLDDLDHDIIQVKTTLYRPEHSVPNTISPSKLSAWPFFSSSPSPSTYAAPSFGTVITTPKPRRVYSLAGYSNSHETLSTTKGPYAHLDLRISMPSQHPPWESNPLVSPPGVRSHQLRATRSSTSLYRLGLHSASRIFNDDIPDTPTKSLDKNAVLGRNNNPTDVE